MTGRLLNRGKTSGRADDNEATIKLRLDTFHKHSKPVVEAYKEKCTTVSQNFCISRFDDNCQYVDNIHVAIKY